MCFFKRTKELYCLWLAYCPYSGHAPRKVSGFMFCTTESAGFGRGASVVSDGRAVLSSRNARPRPSSNQWLVHGKYMALLAIAYRDCLDACGA